MKVLIDGRSLTKKPTGIATYTICIIQAISKYLSDWELVVAMPQEMHDSINDFPKSRVRLIVEPLFGYRKMPRFIWYHLKFPFIAKKENADIIWGVNAEMPILKFGRVKRMITVHDVVWKEYPETMHRSAKFVSIPFLNYSINNADLIICNSRYTISKVEHYYPNRLCRKMVGVDSCSTRFRKINISDSDKILFLDKYKLTKRFILFVGSLEPRKNLPFLLKIMPAIYKKTGAKLLVVGGTKWKNSSINNLITGDRNIRESVVFADFVSFTELVTIYNLATCYVSTSLNEGFGMPQLEAMSCGCPVISPHNSAMIEVVEGRGITVKGWDNKEWIDVIVRTLNDEKLLKKLSNPNISEYKWDVLASKIDKYIKAGL